MIELHGLSDFKRNYEYQNETGKKTENQHSDFNRFISDGSDVSSTAKNEIKENEEDQNLRISGSNLIIYDDFGKLKNLFKFSGTNINILI
jgi:hypothetical protein